MKPLSWSETSLHRGSRRRYLALSALILAVAADPACLSITGEETFSRDRIDAIRPGVTTRQEILVWFGPPALIVRKGDKVYRESKRSGREEIVEVSYDDLVREFPAGTSQSRNLVVYVYKGSTWEKKNIFAPLVSLSDPQITLQQLLILIDQDADVVVDSLFRAESRGDAQ